MEDTICALATTLGESSINIIRISGSDAINIVSTIFTGKDLKKVSSHTINYGHIKFNDEIIDEVLVSVMRAPKTFTKEDIVEINCHGGYLSAKKIIEILNRLNIRNAYNGEFTKRAFLNGRIDLTKSEAINDIITSKTEQERIVALKQLNGSLFEEIERLRSYIMEIMANIEVNIDYPEYEDELVVTHKLLKDRINKIKEKLTEILKNSENGKILKNGINVLLLGRPNVGKSSILNHLIEENKAIVTKVAGTTRDIVEGSFILNGVVFNLLDTAGIHNTNNIVEKIGIEKSLNLINKADIIILVLNNNECLNEEDKNILEKIKEKKHIIFVNKNDLNKKITIDRDVVYGNTLKKDGLDALKQKLLDVFNLENNEIFNSSYLANDRHITILKKCLDIIMSIEKQINEEVPIDIISIDLKECYEALGEIIGKTYKNDLINEIFSKFCLGK